MKMKNPPYLFFLRYRMKMIKRSSRIRKLLQAMTTIMAPFENDLLSARLPLYRPRVGSEEREREHGIKKKTEQVIYAKLVKIWGEHVLKHDDHGDTRGRNRESEIERRKKKQKKTNNNNNELNKSHSRSWRWSDTTAFTEEAHAVEDINPICI